MRLATLRIGGTTTAARVDDDQAVLLNGFTDVGALLNTQDWRTVAVEGHGPSVALSDLDALDWAPVIPRPGKVICVGLNYRSHIEEMGRELPEFPTLFTKYPEALIGPYDPIVVPQSALSTLDWEGELAVVIGRPTRNASVSEATDAIAGYSVLNDVTVRELQYRTTQWLPGKTFESTTPFGPVLVTGRDAEAIATAELTTDVDGEVVQRGTADDLLFGPAELVSSISGILTLQPGDVIATGTPGGVGHARTPRRYLAEGSVMGTTIDRVGRLRNEVRLQAEGGFPAA